MNKNIFAILLFCCSTFAYGQTIEVSGVLQNDTQWDADTILITDNVFIPDTVNLTINAGVTILAYQQKRVEIQGSLTAIGTFDNPILFSAFDTLGVSDTSTVSGTWAGLHLLNLNEQADSSILDHCIIQYGGAYGEEELDKKGGGIFIDQSSKIRISNCIIQNNFAEWSGGGVYLHENSSVVITNNLIQDNKTAFEGGGIMSGENSFPFIENNIIIKNIALIYYEALPDVWTLTGRGGGVLITTLSEEKTTIIKSNIICNNYSNSGSGIYESSFNTQVVSNIICNNRGSGIFTGNTISGSYYVNNTIVNNRDMGIRTLSPNINMINNIVYGNYDHYMGIFIDSTDVRYVEDMNEENFRNNNIGVANIFGEEHINIDILNIGYNNIRVSPLFVNPSESYGLSYNGYHANWSLVSGDANIDAGTTEEILDMLPTKDAYGNDRIQGETIDIGAVEFDPINVVDEGFDNERVSIYPNPFSGQVWIEIEGYQGEVWHLSVWNEHGQHLYSFDVKHQISSINSSNWPSGLYFVEGKNKIGDRIFIKKIIKGK